MSITSDLKSYADNAVNQGKQALDTAQAQLNDVTGQANELYGKTRTNVSDIAEKAEKAVNDLRVTAEKTVNLDAIKTAVEPYISQVIGYTTSVTDRAEALLAEAKQDKRVAQVFDTAGVVVGQVAGQLQLRVVKPVQDLTGFGAKPAPTAAPKPAATKATKSAKSTETAKPATRTTSRPAARSTSKPAARKSTAKKTTKA